MNFEWSNLWHTLLLVFIAAFVCYIGDKVFILIINKISKKVNPAGLHWRLIKYFLKIVWVLVFLLVVIETIPALNKLATTLVACSSVVVAAIGLASQDALKNAIDGIFITIFKPFSVGDRVKLISKNITGTIIDINFRFTSIKTAENSVLMIPNSIINSEIIENSNIVDNRIKAFLDVTVGYDSDIYLVKEVLTKIIVEHPLFVDIRTEEEKEKGVKPVTIMVRDLSDSGVDIRATVCSANISDSFQLCSDLREEVLIEFRKNNIEIPYQTITINKN